jgi:hypothetical protein
MTDVAIPTSAAAVGAPAPGRADGPPESAAPLDFQIVPRKGLILVAVMFVLLVAAIGSNKLWPLEFMHVAGGAAWTIIDLFFGLAIGPIIGKMSVPARIEFSTRMMPKMVLIMPVVVTMTLAAGWQLGHLTGVVFPGAPGHDWILFSYIVVGVMSIIALGLLEPANIAVLFELKKPQPNPAVIERLMKRFVYCAGILGLMQVATLIAMTQVATKI